MKIKLECRHCHKTIYKSQWDIKRAKYNYCSIQCSNIYQPSQSKHIEVQCLQCNKIFMKSRSATIKYPNHFCSRSCSVTYHNLHKTYGTRRSKLEIWIEKKLSELYPTLEIHYNRKDTIGSELDIYIPSLCTAFELNGIFHYEPIFGQLKLDRTQKNDSLKFQSCHKLKIGLCVIDASRMKHFKEHAAHEYLEIITNIINQLI